MTQDPGQPGKAGPIAAILAAAILLSIVVLENRCGIDPEAEFVRNLGEMAAHVSSGLGQA